MFSKVCIMPDWKIIAAVAVAAVIILTSIFASTDALKGLKNIFSGLNLFPEQNVVRKILVSALLAAYGNQALSIEEAEKITIDFVPNSNILVSGQTLDLTNLTSVSIRIEKFEGKSIINFTTNLITIDGAAQKVFVNDIGIASEQAAVKTTDLRVNSIKFVNAEPKQLSLLVSGTMTVDSKHSMKFDSEQLTIDNYFGDIEARGYLLSINGYASKLAATNNLKLAIE